MGMGIEGERNGERTEVSETALREERREHGAPRASGMDIPWVLVGAKRDPASSSIDDTDSQVLRTSARRYVNLENDAITSAFLVDGHDFHEDAGIIDTG